MKPLLCALVLFILVCSGVPSSAQQKGQWVPGQFGLNAGVIPDPGVTYQNLALNYSANALNDSNGNRFPNFTGTYQFWVDENIFMYVPKYKFLGGYFAPWASVNLANGSLVAAIVGTNLSGNGGGQGLADTVVAPLSSTCPDTTPRSCMFSPHRHRHHPQQTQREPRCSGSLRV